MHRALTLTVLVACLVVPPAALGQEATTPLTVTGNGRVEARPDRAEVTYQLNSFGASREAARASIALRARSVLGRLRAVGVDPLGVRLSDVEVRRRSHRPGLRKPFIASAAIAARTADVGLSGRLLDLGTALGADTSGPDFDLVDDAAAREQATTRAVADAQRRAQAVAGGLGMTIVGVRSITLDGAGGPVPLPAASAPTAGRPSTPTAPGVITVTAAVTVVYDLARAGG
jgi:uncharacterized protein YggE